MKIEEAISFFSSLTSDEQKRFLAHLSHYLTVVARDSYETGTENISNQPLIRAVNEVQHQLSAQLLALLENDSRPISDEVLIRIILEHPENKNFETEVIKAFEKVASRFSVAV